MGARWYKSGRRVSPSPVEIHIAHASPVQSTNPHKMNSFVSTKAVLANLALCAHLAAAFSLSSPPWQHPRWQQPDGQGKAATVSTLSTGVSTGSQGDGLSVETTSGVVSGFVNASYPDVRQFLGIPFAEAPTGALRFEPPKARVAPPHTQVKATAPPPACPQIPPSNGTILSLSTPAFLNQQPWSEDCLAVSVWAPKCNSTDAKDKLPVVIWIHGMGLQQGSSSVPLQQPPAWIQRSKEHIVVAVQYRLNIFGFPNGAGLNRTNLGLLDQRMGIEWARNNVAAFGGDPDRMILWGESSGAGSVDAQNFAYPNDPIVQGFISNSGSALFPLGTGLTTSDPTHSNFSTVAKGLGCPSDSAGEASCMRGKPAEDIIGFLANYTAKRTQPALNFVATPDGIVAFANYTERYAKGLLSDKPAIFGTNSNEGVVQLPLPPNPTAMGPNQTTANQLTLGLFQCPAYFSAKLAAAKRKTYLYYYTGNFTDVSPLPWEGAYHMAELPQIFGTRGQFNAPASSQEIETSNAMQDLWLAFAKDPKAAESAGWTEFASGNLLVLGSPGNPVQKAKISDIDAECARH